MKGNCMKHVLGALTLVAIATGCGRQQNPVKQYNNLPGVAEYEQQIPDRKYSVCGVEMKTDPTLIVSEGETASQKVDIRGLNSKAKVILKDAPEGVTLKETTPKDSPNAEFTLSVEGKSSLIPPTSDHAEFEIEIVPPSDDPVLECSEKVGVVILRSKAIPVVSKISPIGTLDSSSTTDRKLSLQVSAPGVIDPLNLKVNRQFDISATSKENPVLDLSQAIRQISNPTLIGKDLYSIDFAVVPEFVEILLKDGLPKGFKKDRIEALFTVSIYNKDTGKVSPEKSLPIIIKLKVPEEAKR